MRRDRPKGTTLPDTFTASGNCAIAMNTYALIIFLTILVSFFLDVSADLLNLRALDPNIPPEFTGVYDAEKYRASQEYTRVNTQFGFLSATVSLIVTFAFWLSGGFQWLDGVARGWGWHPIATGIAYIGLLVIAKTLLSLPFSIYDTFVIEARFGFNQTTPGVFAADLLKSVALSIVIGVPLLAGILAFFQYAGHWAWLACWIATTLVMLFLQFIAPTWIMPLFNTFTPLEDGELRGRILAYARDVDFPLENVFVMDGSKRSTKSNAFFTGFGKHKRIALFDTLLAKHSTDELVVILAHEIGHYKKKHVLKGLLIGIAHTGVMFYLLSIFLHHRGLFEAFYIKQPSIYAGLILFGMLFSPMEELLSVGLYKMMRTHEYEADRFAVETTNMAAPFVNALKTLSVHNLSNLTPHPFYVALNYSHPPVLQRIQAIRNMR